MATAPVWVKPNINSSAGVIRFVLLYISALLRFTLTWSDYAELELRGCQYDGKRLPLYGVFTFVIVSCLSVLVTPLGMTLRQRNPMDIVFSIEAVAFVVLTIAGYGFAYMLTNDRANRIRYRLRCEIWSTGRKILLDFVDDLAARDKLCGVASDLWRKALELSVVCLSLLALLGFDVRALSTLRTGVDYAVRFAKGLPQLGSDISSTANAGIGYRRFCLRNLGRYIAKYPASVWSGVRGLWGRISGANGRRNAVLIGTGLCATVALCYAYGARIARQRRAAKTAVRYGGRATERSLAKYRVKTLKHADLCASKMRGESRDGTKWYLYDDADGYAGIKVVALSGDVEYYRLKHNKVHDWMQNTFDVELEDVDWRASDDRIVGPRSAKKKLASQAPVSPVAAVACKPSATTNVTEKSTTDNETKPSAKSTTGGEKLMYTPQSNVKPSADLSLAVVRIKGGAETHYVNAQVVSGRIIFPRHLFGGGLAHGKDNITDIEVGHVFDKKPILWVTYAKGEVRIDDGVDTVSVPVRAQGVTSTSLGLYERGFRPEVDSVLTAFAVRWSPTRKTYVTHWQTGVCKGVTKSKHAGKDLEYIAGAVGVDNGDCGAYVLHTAADGRVRIVASPAYWCPDKAPNRFISVDYHVLNAVRAEQGN